MFKIDNWAEEEAMRSHHARSWSKERQRKLFRRYKIIKLKEMVRRSVMSARKFGELAMSTRDPENITQKKYVYSDYFNFNKSEPPTHPMFAIKLKKIIADTEDNS